MAFNLSIGAMALHQNKYNKTQTFHFNEAIEWVGFLQTKVILLF